MKKTPVVIIGLCVVVLAMATAFGPAKKQAAAPRALAIYSDGIVGPVVTFSAGFDTTKYKLAGNPKTAVKLFVKEQYAPVPADHTTRWIQCDATQNPAGANCGAGKANIFFTSENDGVTPWGQLLSDGKTWMVTARAQPQSAGQAWRARIELDVVPKP